MKEVKVWTQNSDGERLVGIRACPDAKKDKYSTVLLVHGFGMTKDEYKGLFVSLSQVLTEIGYLVYRFDASGCGESEGDYSKTTLTKQVGTLRKVVEFLKSESEVDVNNIAILAQSFGTSAVIVLHPKVEAIALLGSFHRLEKIFVNHFGQDYNPDGVSKISRSDDSILEIGPQFWQDLRKHNLLDDIKQNRANLLFVHGTEDDICPIEEMEALFKAANEPKKKVVIEGNDHGQNPHQEKMRKVVINWFKKCLV